MCISQRTNVNSQSCPIRCKRNQVYGQLPAFCAFLTRLPRSHIFNVTHRRIRGGQPIISFRKYITLDRCQQGAKIGSAEEKKRRPGSGLMVKQRPRILQTQTHERIGYQRLGMVFYCARTCFCINPPQWFNRTPRHNLRHALHGSDAIQRPRCVVHHGSGEISGLGAATTRLLPTKAGALPQGCLVDLVRRD